MPDEQLQLDLAAPAPDRSLTSPWCPVPAELLEKVWERLAALTRGKTRLMVKVPGGEFFEVDGCRSRWQIIAQGKEHGGNMGSCMSRPALRRVLQKFLRP